MLKRSLILWLIIITLSILSIPTSNNAVAQSGLEPNEGRWTHLEYNQEGDCFGQVSLTLEDVLETPDFQPNFTLFKDEFSETFIAAFDGPDYIYIPNGAGEYQVGLLQEMEGFRFFGNATVTEDGEEMLFSGTLFIDENCILNFTHTYIWLEESPATIWIETERQFTDVSFFNECLGRINGVPSEAWAQHDLAIPIDLDLAQEEGLLLVGSRPFSESEGAYVFEESGSSADLATYMAISLLPLSDTQIQVSAFYQINDRSDCSIIYESTYFKQSNLFEYYVDEEIVVPNAEYLQEIEDEFNDLDVE